METCQEGESVELGILTVEKSNGYCNSDIRGHCSDENNYSGGRSDDFNKKAEAEVAESPQRNSMWKNFKTASLYLSYFALGITTPLVGATMVHMGKLFESSTQTMSFVFPASSIGFIIGGIMCGLIFDRTNKELSFSISVIIASITTCASAFTRHVYGFIACNMLMGIPAGFLVTGGQSYCVNLWLNQRLKEPILQGTQAIWSLGAAIGPFIIEQFLCELSDHNEIAVFNQSYSFSDNQAQKNTSEIFSTPESYHDFIENKPDISKVRFAFVWSGGIFLLVGIPFMAIYLAECILTPRRASEKHRESEKATDKKKNYNENEENRCLDFSFLIMLSFFGFLLVYIEIIPIAYFVSFCIIHLKWSVTHASLVLSIFFWAHFTGRVLGIIISAYLKPRTMLVTNLLISTSAYVMLMFVNWSHFLMWISAALAGFGISSTFPTVILYFSETIPFTGRVSSFLTVGASTGALIAPLLVGFLFESHSPMWMVYIALFASICLFIFCLLLMLFVFKFKDRLQKTDKPAQH